MKNKHIRQTVIILTTILFTMPKIVEAMDLHYDPALDAPESAYTEYEATPKHFESVIKHPTNKTLTRDKKTSPPEEGWSVKLPVISSDKTPYITDGREAVRVTEEQRWLKSGKNEKNYDENPLNSDNYRITVEAEYSF